VCGIAGWVGTLDADAETLRWMTHAIRHRGPDDEGSLIHPGRVALGFRRLSIIDLIGGNQPLFDETRSTAVTCNGEIYNFPQLRAGLEQRGHTFETGSDIEVVPHLYEERGIDCVHALQGMFAIALWDDRRQRLLLARDRIGVKPLYWAPGPGGLVYASEPAAILASGLVAADPDPVAIMQYLTLQYVPAPRTGFSSIRKLAPGERLVYENGRVQIDRYWALAGETDGPAPGEEPILETLDRLLADATRCRLLSDVPLGAFLSGGVDSSLVVSYMAEALGRVKTFSIDVPELGFSEREHARRVADLYGTDHTELTVEAEMVPTVAETIHHVGEPFADSSAVPTYLVSQVTRRRVTVALSGDGGDEAFGGYSRFLRAAQLDRIAALARGPARIADAVLPRALLRRSRLLEHRLALLSGSAHDRYAMMVTHFRPRQLDRICSSEFIAAAGGTRSAWDDVLALPRVADANRYLLLDATTYLPGDILLKVDRMSMAHALEVRSPLLDYRVQQFAASLPAGVKIRRGETKWPLKELALKRGIPERNVRRPKMGFAIPVARWFRGPLREWLADLIVSDVALGRGYFEPSEIRRLFDEHQAGVDRDPLLWNLAMLELWHRSWIDGGSSNLRRVA
jgi:asparagine synthase (glutamine-hydrolysing)